MAREKRIVVRMTEEELAEAHKLAQGYGMTLSDFIRWLLSQVSAGTIRPPRD